MSAGDYRTLTTGASANLRSGVTYDGSAASRATNSAVTETAVENREHVQSQLGRATEQPSSSTLARQSSALVFDSRGASRSVAASATLPTVAMPGSCLPSSVTNPLRHTDAPPELGQRARAPSELPRSAPGTRRVIRPMPMRYSMRSNTRHCRSADSIGSASSAHQCEKRKLARWYAASDGTLRAWMCT